jgi:hypothetical protein
MTMPISATTPRNPGIVPPWLQTTAPVAPKNPGIVPPWLTNQKTLPASGPAARVETKFVSLPTTLSPMTFVDALRIR